MKPAFYVVNDFAMMVGGAVWDIAAGTTKWVAGYVTKRIKW